MTGVLSQDSVLSPARKPATSPSSWTAPRWAERRNRPRSLGHRAGVRAVQVCLEFCLEEASRRSRCSRFPARTEPPGRRSRRDDEAVPAHARPRSRRAAPPRCAHRLIGDRSGFSESIRSKMRRAEVLTPATRRSASTSGGYGGRWDIARAARALAAEAVAGHLPVAAIDEAALGRAMALADQPEPDLFHPTGGDLRISNFLLWQLAYTEMWFTETLWPDLDRPTLAPGARRLRQPRAPLRHTSAKVWQGAAHEPAEYAQSSRRVAGAAGDRGDCCGCRRPGSPSWWPW